MNYRKTCILLTFFVFSHLSFAQQHEQGWIKRSWNNMIAHYNIYFNAQQKLDAALLDLYASQKDNFEEIIPVYPYGDENSAKNMRAPMEAAMKKASKVIQTKPRSKWVDDAYFLIGQTHFFRGDEYAAIEVFQFIFSTYTDPEIKAKARLWVMKCYLRQDKLNDAEAILGLIKDTETDDRKLQASIFLVAGDLYVKQEKYALAIEYLEKGVKLTKDRTLRYRTHFVLGQLYLESGEFSKANEHFVRVIKMNAPYDYVFQANLGMTRATAESGGKGLKSTKKYLKRMLNDDKNIDYFDQIYYELALLEFSEGNEQQGLDYMLKSSANAKTNPAQQTKTYLYLADYFFNKREYSRSQSYYDSVITVLPKDYEDYDRITGKHAVLSQLIEQIEMVYVQDSLLKLAALPREELDRMIDEIVEEEIRKQRLKAEEEELERQRSLMNTGGRGGTIPAAEGDEWYFYNQATVARGYNEFMRTWGKRKYGDWWRFANKIETETGTVDPVEDPVSYDAGGDEEQQEALKDIAQDKLKYYKDIPFSSTAKLIANKRIQNALLEISKIYFNYLKEYNKSIANLETLLTRYPETSSRAEAIFYLAKSWMAIGDTAKYDKYAKIIADEYPESLYNQVLNNKEVVETGEDEKVIALYNKMFAFYSQQQYDSVKSIKLQVDRQYAGNSIQAKFDYLYALTVGVTEGEEAYLGELSAIRDNYPGTEIANLAAYTITLLSSDRSADNVDFSIYSSDLEGVHYYVITGNTTDVKKVELDLTEYNERFFPSKTFQIKSLVFGDKQLFFIKAFDSKQDAESYHIEMKSNYSFLVSTGLTDIGMYAITDDNFATLIKSGEESLYLYFFNKYYPFEL